MHGEISLSFLCSHTSWRSALVLVLSLCVGHPQASVPHPDWSGLKHRLIRWFLFTQARGREGYRIQGEPTAAETGVTFQQPEVCRVLLGKLSLDLRTLAMVCSTGSRGGRWMWVVTCVCTQDSWWQ